VERDPKDQSSKPEWPTAVLRLFGTGHRAPSQLARCQRSAVSSPAGSGAEPGRYRGFSHFYIFSNMPVFQLGRIKFIIFVSFLQQKILAAKAG